MFLEQMGGNKREEKFMQWTTDQGSREQVRPSVKRNKKLGTPARGRTAKKTLQ
jgi:hypothetical protein